MQVYFVVLQKAWLYTIPETLRGLKQMSASKEKKTRQDLAAASSSDPKTAREAKQRREEKRNNRIYILIAVVFVVVAVVSITWKSGIVQRKATAATINGENYSSAEVLYYYKTAYQNFISNYSSYLSYFNLDTSKDLKSQTCGLDSDGGTWYDYFLKQGLTTMSAVHALSDAAAKDDYTWNDDMQKSLDDTLSSVESNAKNYGYTLEQYLKASYGSIMTKSVYEAQLKLGILAQSYSTNYTDGLKYTTDDLKAAYAKDPNSYDVVDYQSVKIDGAPAAKTDSDGNTVDATDAEKTAAMTAAEKTANTIYTDFKAGGDLSTLADKYDTATYTDGKAGTYSDTVLMNWLFSDTRKAGDYTLLTDKDGSAYYVVKFTSRYRYDYNTVDVRQILIQPETGTKQEGDDGYDAEQTQLKAAAKTKAEDLLAQWKAGEATEDSFATLATSNSSDTGSASNGGLYTQVYQGQMVQSFNDWCFDSSRKTGDTGIVESDYGYHIIYFVGEDLPYWQVQVTNTLKSNDYNDWYSGITKDYTATQHSFGLKFVG